MQRERREWKKNNKTHICCTIWRICVVLDAVFNATERERERGRKNERAQIINLPIWSVGWRSMNLCQCALYCNWKSNKFYTETIFSVALLLFESLVLNAIEKKMHIDVRRHNVFQPKKKCIHTETLICNSLNSSKISCVIFCCLLISLNEIDSEDFVRKKLCMAFAQEKRSFFPHF